MTVLRGSEVNLKAFNQLEVYLHDKNGGEEVQEVKRELRQPGEPLPPEAI